METHRLLTLLGLILLVATIGIYYSDDKSENEFSLAYVPGIAMIIVFLTSLALINKNRFKEQKPKK